MLRNDLLCTCSRPPTELYVWGKKCFASQIFGATLYALLAQKGEGEKVRCMFRVLDEDYAWTCTFFFFFSGEHESGLGSMVV